MLVAYFPNTEAVWVLLGVLSTFLKGRGGRFNDFLFAYPKKGLLLKMLLLLNRECFSLTEGKNICWHIYWVRHNRTLDNSKSKLSQTSDISK